MLVHQGGISDTKNTGHSQQLSSWENVSQRRRGDQQLWISSHSAVNGQVSGHIRNILSCEPPVLQQEKCSPADWYRPVEFYSPGWPLSSLLWHERRQPQKCLPTECLASPRKAPSCTRWLRILNGMSFWYCLDFEC